MFYMRDMGYGNFSEGTQEKTLPDPEEQASLQASDTLPSKRVDNHGKILTWLGIIILAIVLLHFAA